ncbi:hypothetical protein B0J18DRAFT_161224 [Chaetomium sp. MPI-SDFR-AT-0129]|nr:hypothetical protein B0J18DRAFT_161224 [Chaetomium sp. MPI-SDFR-AT-0129]
MATTSPPPTASTATATTSTDPFDSLLTLEDQFYTEGYNQGMADGLAAGRTEGRQLGLERGFQKFAEAGRLQGRAIVWANRLGGGGTKGGRGGESSGEGGGRSSQETAATTTSTFIPTSITTSTPPTKPKPETETDTKATEPHSLPPLPPNPRLSKHITTLYALSETESLSTENNDEAVDDFDDRLRRAQGRFKVIERMVGEGGMEKEKDASQGVEEEVKGEVKEEVKEEVAEGGKDEDGQGHGHDPGDDMVVGKEGELEV